MELYGHPFSSYTWKAEIALVACGIAYEFRMLDGEHPANGAVVAAAGPGGQFPVLVDGGRTLFEATAIIEWLAATRDEARGLIPADPLAAVEVRMMDRAFDNHVMAPMQGIVSEHMRSPGSPDAGRVAAAEARLERSYDWLEARFARVPPGDGVGLVECAAAPALFYADWVVPIGAARPLLSAWRARLLALPAVKHSVEAARPYRAYFPPGAPDRD